MSNTVVLAGANGNLGGRIARALLERGATVRALVRPGSKAQALAAAGATLTEVNYADTAGLRAACEGAGCVVSALNGLRPVIVDAQAALLDAAVQAGVPRFIPSDYSIDFTRLTPGENRNLDLRREFYERLDKANIAATSIFNGAFADMLTGQAPFILFKWKRVLVWGEAAQPMDFTTVEDTARYTAAAALDPSTPRALHIAGSIISASGLAELMTELTGQPHRLFRPGGLGRLGLLIKVVRTLNPAPDEPFPPWQGMQYMRDMFGGRALPATLDNQRYPGLTWTTVREVLAARG